MPYIACLYNSLKRFFFLMPKRGIFLGSRVPKLCVNFECRKNKNAKLLYYTGYLIILLGMLANAVQQGRYTSIYNFSLLQQNLSML